MELIRCQYIKNNHQKAWLHGFFTESELTYSQSDQQNLNFNNPIIIQKIVCIIHLEVDGKSLNGGDLLKVDIKDIRINDSRF
jgi:hypothetical protein